MFGKLLHKTTRVPNVFFFIQMLTIFSFRTEDARKDVPLLLTHITKSVPVSGFVSMNCVIIIIYYVPGNQIKKLSQDVEMNNKSILHLHQ